MSGSAGEVVPMKLLGPPAVWPRGLAFKVWGLGFMVYGLGLGFGVETTMMGYRGFKGLGG